MVGSTIQAYGLELDCLTVDRKSLKVEEMIPFQYLWRTVQQRIRWNAEQTGEQGKAEHVWLELSFLPDLHTLPG